MGSVGDLSRCGGSAERPLGAGEVDGATRPFRRAAGAARSRASARMSRPITSNQNWDPLRTIANSAKIRADGQMSVYVERSRAHVIVDVAAYVL